MKHKIGCWLHERWRVELVLRFPRLARRCGLSWEDFCNRHERLIPGPNGRGRLCTWEDSSTLTVARVFPHVGGRIFQHCLRQWPIELDDVPRAEPPAHPDVSVVVGVRGTKRLPQFHACLASLRGQKDIVCETVVVEQSRVAEFRDLVPADVQYVHQPIPSADVPFNRSWALNLGARVARAPIVVLFDADMLLPEKGAAALANCLQREADAVRIARLLFYLDRTSSELVQQTRDFATATSVGRIVENNPTPVAVRRDCYLEIGGHDESFFGWGGEDNEFTDRLRTRRYCEAAFLPIVHLWHEEAPNRSGDRNAPLLARLREIPPNERIRALAARDFGRLSPSVEWAPSPQLQ